MQEGIFWRSRGSKRLGALFDLTRDSQASRIAGFSPFQVQTGMRNTRDKGMFSSGRYWLPFMLVLTLSACGSDNDNSSGSSSSSPSSSSSSYSGGIDNADNTGGITDAQWPDINVVSTEPKQLHFSWTAVEGADHYRLLKDPDGNSGYSVVEGQGNLTTAAATDTIAVHQHQWQDAMYIVEACLDADCNESQDSNAQLSTTAMLDAIGYIKASNTGEADWFGWSLALSEDGRTLAVGAIREASQARGVDGDQSDDAVFGAGAVYVFHLNDGLWLQEAYLKASNTEAPSENEDGRDTTVYNDRFGAQLSLSANGDVLAVGVPLEDSSGSGVNPDSDDNDAVNTGAVYVFKRDESGWTQNAFLKASNADAAPEEGEEEEEDTTEDGSGDEDANEPPPNASDRFGHRVAISGDGLTLAVSAIYEASSATGINGDESLNDLGNVGAVYVFTDSGDTWAQQAYIKPSNSVQNHLFGESLALSSEGNRLAVGAPGDSSIATGVDGDEDNTNRPGTGAVFVFDRTDNEWSQSAYLKPDRTYNDIPNSLYFNNGYRQNFGAALSLSSDGNTLAVSMPGDLSTQTGVSDGSDAHDFGNLDTLALYSGAVYVFERDSSGWEQGAFLKASNSMTNLRFGHLVRLSASGDQLAISSLRDASAETGINGVSDDASKERSGAVYYFERGNDGWSETAYIKSANTDTYDSFGNGLSLSGDGKMLAVGAPREDSAATGINGDRGDDSATDSGAVYLY